MTNNKLTGLRYGHNAQYLLSELASYDADDIDGDEFEVYGEDSNGIEGSATISITELAADAAKLLAAKDAELQRYRNEPRASFYRDGIATAAEWVDQQRESYDNEHGRHDPDTGAFEFGNDAQRDYSATLVDIAEGIRALHPNADIATQTLTDAERAELQEYRNAPVSLLRCFYVAYDGWLKNGANDGGIFNSETGLCANAYDYFKEIGVDSAGPLNEMHAAFVAAGLNEKLPFNESPEQYAEEQSRGGCYANPSRVEWVRRQVTGVTGGTSE